MTYGYGAPRDPTDVVGRRIFAYVIDILLAAGAKTDLYPEMKGYIDEIYRRAGRSDRRV